jgi:transcriptional regulator
MYVPRHFSESDRARLFDFIQANSFAVLVSAGDGHFVASHLPVLLKRDVPPNGRLVGHMARANPQWRSIAEREVLCVFSGPHAYISPAWYEAQNVVPTWNYVAVHVYGACQIVDDEAAATEIVAAYVSTYEGSRPSPWTIDPAAPFFRKMIKQIVAFRIDISRIEGKWKLGQNHPRQRREKVARRLEDSADWGAREIGRLMHETL